MAVIRCAEHSVQLGDDETVLEGLERIGVPIASSCRSGICQTCMIRATEGPVPPAAQNGLTETQRLRGYFLACVCQPKADLSVILDDQSDQRISATVAAAEPLTPEILCLSLDPAQPIAYRAGQFVHIFKDRLDCRSYSLASVPGLDPNLQLHVRRLPGGKVSNWIHDELKTGTTVEIRGPSGDCFYAPGRPEQPLLLIGTGSGLAPLYGVLRDALAQGHSGSIHLYHGSRDRNGIYLVDELRELEERYPQLRYTPCLSGDTAAPFTHGRADVMAFQDIPKLDGWRVFLCGHPEMVNQARRKSFLAGAALGDILADAFTVGSSPAR